MKYAMVAMVVILQGCTPIPEWNAVNPCDPAYSGPASCGDPVDTGFQVEPFDGGNGTDSGQVETGLDAGLDADLDPVGADIMEGVVDTSPADDTGSIPDIITGSMCVGWSVAWHGCRPASVLQFCNTWLQGFRA